MKGLRDWAQALGRAIFSLHLLRIHSLSADRNDLHPFFQKTKKVLALKNTTSFPATNPANNKETKVWVEGIHIYHLCLVHQMRLWGSKDMGCASEGHSLPLSPEDGALNSADTKHVEAKAEGQGLQARYCCAAPGLQHSPASETAPMLYPMGVIQRQNRMWWATGSEQGCCLCVKIMTVLGNFSTSIWVLASPVSHREVRSCPQPLLHCLHAYGEFISSLSHHHSGSSCSVAHPVWLSPSPCSRCSI